MNAITPAESAHPSWVRLVLGMLAAYIAMQVAAALIALPYPEFLPPVFAALMRTPEEGLHMPSILGGQAVVAAALIFLYQRVKPRSRGAAALLGYVLGLAVFFGGHMIIGGWSKFPPGPMAVTGFLDAFAVAVGGIVLDLIYRRRAAP